MSRDSRQDPQPGDVITKTSAKGKTITRTVTRRNGNDVYYRSGDSQKELNCWITTWWDWSRTADEPKE